MRRKVFTDVAVRHRVDTNILGEDGENCVLRSGCSMESGLVVVVVVVVYVAGSMLARVGRRQLMRRWCCCDLWGCECRVW